MFQVQKLKVMKALSGNDSCDPFFLKKNLILVVLFVFSPEFILKEKENCVCLFLPG